MMHAQPPSRPRTQRRRHHARFEAALRVEYVLDQRKVLALSRVLSEGGMLLGNSTSPLPPDAELDLTVQLTDSLEPLRIRARVLAITRRGTRLQFLANQSAQVARLRKFIVSKVIPTLLNELKRPEVNLRRVCELAELYVDYGRPEEAMQLYRDTLAKRGFERLLCENMARLYMDQLAVTASGPARGRFIYELNDLVQRSLKDLPDSEVLATARQVVLASTGRAEAPPPLPQQQAAPVAAAPAAIITPAPGIKQPGPGELRAPVQSYPSLAPGHPTAMPTHAPPPQAEPIPTYSDPTPTYPAPVAPALASYYVPPSPPHGAHVPPTGAASYPVPQSYAAPPAMQPVAPPSPVAYDKVRLAAYQQAAAFAQEYTDAELQAVRDSMAVLYRRVQDLDAERKQLTQQLQDVRSELSRERAEASRASKHAHLNEEEEAALGVFKLDEARGEPEHGKFNESTTIDIRQRRRH